MFGEHRARLIRKFLIDKESSPVERSCPYNSRPGDVIICGYFRSGTTWLQQILHQIRCGGGDESYADIDEVVWSIPPYMERLDFDLNADQGHKLRLFRCHDCYEDAPMNDQKDRSIKYIVIARDPLDVGWSEMRSRYRNLGVDKDYDAFALTELDSISCRQSNDKFQMTRPIYYPSYWEHFLSWWANKKQSNVFWLHYEDLQKNLRLCIIELARFIGVHLTDEQLNRVYEHCTYEYMRQNADKFSGEFLINLQTKMLGVTPWRPLVGRVSRTTEGAQSGLGSLNLNEKTKASIRWNWRHSIEKLTGYRSYTQLCASNGLVRRVQMRELMPEIGAVQRKNTLHLL